MLIISRMDGAKTMASTSPSACRPSPLPSARNGVAVSATGHDTLTGTEDFFSYRRNTLQGVRDYGRGLSAIALAA